MEIKNKATEICPTTTFGRVQEGALLVDVREVDEVVEAAYDVPKIINIPLSEFEERFAEVPKDQPVIMVCRSGGRSLKATYFLVNHGYRNVVNMQHGILRWAEKGFPIKGALQPISANSCDCSKPNCC
jgi:rhodanese-related sulfurtransferase